MPWGPDARLVVRPGGPLAGTVVPPGDKSITHRACILGLLARGETVVENPNPGADCQATLACLAALGAHLGRGAGTVAIRGRDLRLAEPARVLDCANSGTTLRLLAGPLAAQPFLSILAGDASLHRRPVARVVEPLRRMGAQLWARDGDRLPPLVIRGGPLRAMEHKVPVASAQVASCLLLAGLYAEGRTVVTLPAPARDHTERLLHAFGVAVEAGRAPTADRPGAGALLRTAGGYALAVTGPARLEGVRVQVPGDFSAAAFFLAAAAATPGASVTARAVGLNPTRTGLLGVLERMGAQVARTVQGEAAGEPVGEVTVTGPPRLLPCEIGPQEIPALIDEIPAWVVAASAAHGTSRLSGAAELRLKESDRLAVLSAGLARLGIRVEEHAEGLAIAGGPIGAGEVDAHHDHRIAMAFAMLGGRAAGPVTITGAGAIETSYPGFAAALAALGGKVAEPAAVGRP